MARTRHVAFLAGALLAGCDCGGGDAAPGAVSCSTHTPPLDEARTIGAVSLIPDGRRLSITGLPETSRWVIGRGPALSTEPFAPALDEVEALGPDGVLILGALGTGARLEELVTALASLSIGDRAVPVLLVPGPRDRVDDLDQALEAHGAPHVLSLAGVHVLSLGATEQRGTDLVVAAGGLDGRYVLEGGCHVSDLGELLETRDRERLGVLLGFDAPAGTPLTLGLDGAEAGSVGAREAMEGAGVVAGIFAGPDTRVGVWLAAGVPVTSAGLDRQIIVPPLAGPAVEAADGTRAPSRPMLVAIGPEGIGPAAAQTGARGVP